MYVHVHTLVLARSSCRTTVLVEFWILIGQMNFLEQQF